jgi:Protein of unknown function (DUF3631)
MTCFVWNNDSSACGERSPHWEAPSLDPSMPPELRNRAADNWRVLIAIADAASREWGEAARAAAIELSWGQDEDLPVELLTDIRRVFDQLATDRLASSVLVQSLIDAPDSQWAEWRGPRGDQLPHRLTQASMASVLAPFNIRSRTIWPLRVVFW